MESIVFIEDGSRGQGAALGSAGLQSQFPGQASTVGALAGASGGIAAGGLVEPSIGGTKG